MKSSKKSPLKQKAVAESKKKPKAAAPAKASGKTKKIAPAAKAADAKTVADLAKSAAEYNPRFITEKRLTALGKSYETYGDLSGIVYNRRSKTLVSGHQRIKTLKDKKTRIITQPHKDQFGTVAVGYVEVSLKDGDYKIPYRVVDWSDVKAEKAANIAANAHGGEFDNSKLSKLLEEIESDTFDIELLGLDPLTVRQLTSQGRKEGSTSDPEAEDYEGEVGFEEYGDESFDLQHTCPRCKFQF